MLDQVATLADRPAGVPSHSHAVHGVTLHVHAHRDAGGPQPLTQVRFDEEEDGRVDEQVAEEGIVCGDIGHTDLVAVGVDAPQAGQVMRDAFQ